MRTRMHTQAHTRAHTQAHQEGFQRLQTGGSGSGGQVRAIAHGALEEGEGSKPQSVLEGEVRDEGCQAPAEHRARTTPSSSSTAAAITAAAAAAAAAKSQGPQPDVGVGMGDAQHCNCNLSWFLKCGTDDKPQTGTWQQQQQRPASRCHGVLLLVKGQGALLRHNLAPAVYHSRVSTRLVQLQSGLGDVKGL